jgi:DNA-binding response OmpR family regulator
MSRRVLIIDDEEDIREVAALSLETVAGWDVLVAASGAAGIIKRAKTTPTPFCLTS